MPFEKEKKIQFVRQRLKFQLVLPNDIFGGNLNKKRGGEKLFLKGSFIEMKMVEMKRLFFFINLMEYFGDGALALLFYFQIAMSGWANGYSYRCQPVDYSDNPLAIRVSCVHDFPSKFYIPTFSHFFPHKFLLSYFYNRPLYTSDDILHTTNYMSAFFFTGLSNISLYVRYQILFPLLSYQFQFLQSVVTAVCY